MLTALRRDRLVILLLALLIAGAGWLVQEQRAGRRRVAELAARVETERLWRERLERELAARERRRAAYREDLQALVAAGRDRLASLERRVGTLVATERAGERIIRAYEPGVALIQGTVVYEDAAGRPLRYSDGDARAGFGFTAEGNGPVVRDTFLGTGFLVSRGGAILTSRHVVQPWAGDEEGLGAALDLQGVTPRLVELRAFFPGLPDPIAVTPAGAAGTVDLVVVRGAVPPAVPVVPLDRSGHDAVPGRAVVVLGYPGGLELLLARIEPGLLEDLVGPDVGPLADPALDVGAILERLARLGQIRPYATQGHLAETRPHQLAHDGATTVGGSGGPIFATSGRVIGISTAVARGLDRASLGVPVRSALPLLREAAGGPPPAGR
jgi:S1-C subfamily serine protease